MSVRLFVGGDGGTVQGEKQTLYGDRCFTGAIRLKSRLDLSRVCALLDSGAFSDPPSKRLTPAQALERQLEWERKALSFCSADDWHVHALASYDRLIDETWIGDTRQKKRWSLRDAESAVEETIAAAHYLASQRERLVPRKLVLTAQGVDAMQYVECAEEVLKVATPDDWFGFGGWCIIGRNTRMLPELKKTLSLVLPMVADASVKHVHIFGVMWQPALGALLWVADRHGLTVSTDSSAPVLACTWKNKKKSGAREFYWRDNVEWWQKALKRLRDSDYYEPVPQLEISRQLELFAE